MANYDLFAEHYDIIMGDPIDKVKFIKNLIHSHASNAKTVLELACGTGAVLKQFEKEYEVFGLEFSPEMCKRAQEKFSEGVIVQGDMRSFSLDRRFDVVLCVFDSINHLLTLTEWEQTFIQVKRHLTPEGVFIFDMNTAYCLQKKLEEPAWVKTFDGNTLHMKVKKDVENLVNWHVEIFKGVGENMTRFYEENIKEVGFSVGEVLEVLEKHFSQIEIMDRTGQGVVDTTDRVFFVCRG